MDIKDYLHLYLGCDVYDDYDNNIKILESVAIENQRATIRLPNRVTQHIRLFSEVKLILRKLQDMTEEEMLYCGFNTIANPAHYMKDEVFSFDQVKYLLSKHFDLFNLIENGLALDAATKK